MDPLRKATIRLASSHPKGSKFRKALLQVLAEADFDPTDISAPEPGALEQDSDEPYMRGNFTEQETQELRQKQEKGQLPGPDSGPAPVQMLDKQGGEAELRKATIRLASQHPKGSKLRKALLETLHG